MPLYLAPRGREYTIRIELNYSAWDNRVLSFLHAAS